MGNWIDIWLKVLYSLGWFSLVYMIIVMGFYLILFIISSFHLRKQYELDEIEPYEELLDASYTKPVSIIVPAYNEEAGIYASVRSLLSIKYPQYEVIVVNDGSTDQTLQILKDKFKMAKVNRVVRIQLKSEEINDIYQSTISKNLYCIDKKNGGKADALNAGINLSNYPYVCSLDGDSVLERDAFLKVMKPIIDSDEDVIASGGSIRIANGCEIESGEIKKIGLSKKPIVIMQVIEYFRAFLMGRIGLSRHNMLLIVSGAFGVFSKEWLIKAGGYKRDTVGEDMELIIRLHRLIREEGLNKKILYVPDPVCWTEAPESTNYLRKQRNRWHRGLFESLWAHKGLTFNPKYGFVGMISMPYFLFIEFIGPIVELLGYITLILALFLGGIYFELGIFIFLISLFYGSIFSMMAVLLEEWSLKKYPKITDIIRLFLFSLTETFWYRPLTVIWRVEGIWQLIRKQREWGSMKRKGVSD